MTDDKARRVALVTGAGSGIGRATALAFAKAGHAVVLSDRNPTAGADSLREIEATGGPAMFVLCDVADRVDVCDLFEQAIARFGRIDVLVNNAGTTKFIPFEKLDQVTDDTWEWLYKVNVVGAFHCARAVRDAMIKSGGGVIINVSSVAAQLGQGSSIPCCCTKAAVDN